MTTACLTPDNLRAFLAGELAPDEEAAVARHLEGCTSCEGQVERLSDDGSARALLAEHRRTATDRGQLPPEVVELRERLHVLGWCGSDADPVFPDAPTCGSGDDGTMDVSGERGEPHPAPVFGKFTILRRIGKGGFGVVYLARDSMLNRHVALKLARASVLADPDLKRRFLREAEALARLDHPNIVPVYEVGQHDGTCFLAMGFCNGPTLADWLRTQGTPVNPRLAARIALSLAEAVQHAHQHSILHRDIKPGNVLLARPDEPGQRSTDLPFIPKLTDFGVAKLTERTTETTLAGAIVGTPQYMAPEQAAGLVERVGPATDVYSLGAVLYEMLTAHPPIRGTNTVDTLRRVLIDEPPRPSLGALVPDDLDAIVMKAIDKSPTRRYASAQQLADDLRRFLDGRPTVARPLSLAQRAVRWVQRNPSTSALAALATVVIALSIGLFAYARQYDAFATESSRQRADDAYVFGMQAASELVNKGDVTRAAAELRNLVPAEGHSDPRGLEWHYLWALTTREPFASAATEKAGPAPHDPGDVYQVCLSPQADQLAAACRDGSLYLLDAKHLKVQAKILTGKDEINGVAYSPSGQHVATVGDDGFVRIWDARGHVLLKQFKAHEARAYNVVYFDGDRKLATCGEEPIIRLWDADTLKSAGTLEGHTAPVEAIVLSPAGDLLASASDDRLAIIWDLAKGEIRTRLAGHQAKLSCLCFSPDGKWLASGATDSEVRLWRHADERCRSRGLHFDAIQSVCFTRDGRLLVGDRGGAIRAYHLGLQFPDKALENALEKPEDNWLAHDGRVWSLALLPGENRFVSSGRDGWLRTWSREQNVMRPWKADDQDDRYAADYSRDGSRLLVVSQRQGIEVVDRTTLKSQGFMTEPNTLWESLTVLKGRGQVAAASQTGEVFIFNWKARNPRQDWKVEDHPIQRMTFSPPANLLAVVAHAREDVLLIDPNTGERRGVLPAPSCTDCAFSPDGRRLIVDTLNQLAIFDTKTRGRLRLVPGHRGNINALTYSSDGQFIATGSSDRTVRLWTAEGDLVADLGGYGAGVLTVAFTADGKSLVTGSEDGRMKIFHVPTRRELIDVSTGFKCIRHLSIAPDNRQIAVIGDDWKLALFNIPQRDEED